MVLLVSFYSDASVPERDLQDLFFQIGIVLETCCNAYVPSLSELQSVGQEVHQDLLQSLRVSLYNEVHFFKVCEVGSDFYSELVGDELLNIYYFQNSVSDIKTLTYFFQLVLPQPSVVKKVVNQKNQDLGRGVHDFVDFAQADLESFEVLNYCLRLYQRHALRVGDYSLEVNEEQNH